MLFPSSFTIFFSEFFIFLFLVTSCNIIFRFSLYMLYGFFFVFLFLTFYVYFVIFMNERNILFFIRANRQTARQSSGGNRDAETTCVYILTDKHTKERNYFQDILRYYFTSLFIIIYFLLLFFFWPSV